MFLSDKMNRARDKAEQEFNEMTKAQLQNLIFTGEALETLNFTESSLCEIDDIPVIHHNWVEFDKFGFVIDCEPGSIKAPNES